jgi:hypothetical protein
MLWRDFAMKYALFSLVAIMNHSVALRTICARGAK